MLAKKKTAECYLVWLQPNIGSIGWLKFLAIPHKISVNECEKNVRIDLGYIYILLTKQIYKYGIYKYWGETIDRYRVSYV